MVIVNVKNDFLLVLGQFGKIPIIVFQRKVVIAGGFHYFEIGALGHPPFGFQMIAPAVVALFMEMALGFGKIADDDVGHVFSPVLSFLSILYIRSWTELRQRFVK
jgi:hypothetical protein